MSSINRTIAVFHSADGIFMGCLNDNPNRVTSPVRLQEVQTSTGVTITFTPVVPVSICRTPTITVPCSWVRVHGDVSSGLIARYEEIFLDGLKDVSPAPTKQTLLTERTPLIIDTPPKNELPATLAFGGTTATLKLPAGASQIK